MSNLEEPGDTSANCKLNKKREQVKNELMEKLYLKRENSQRRHTIQGVNTLFRVDLLAKANKINVEESLKQKEKETKKKHEKI